MKVEKGKYYEVRTGYNGFYVLEGSTIETDHDIVKIGPHIKIFDNYHWEFDVSYNYKESFDNGKIFKFKSIIEISKETYDEYIELKSKEEAKLIATKKRLEEIKRKFNELEEKAAGKWFFNNYVLELKESKEYIRRLQQFINRMEMKNEI